MGLSSFLGGQAFLFTDTTRAVARLQGAASIAGGVMTPERLVHGENITIRVEIKKRKTTCQIDNIDIAWGYR
jgi:hypothetical protein